MAEIIGQIASPDTAQINEKLRIIQRLFDNTNNLYVANSILKADDVKNPIALTVAEQTIIGRITDGNIAALTAAQVSGILTWALRIDGTRPGATTQVQDFGSNGLSLDKMVESTTDAGVTIEGVKAENNNLNVPALTASQVVLTDASKDLASRAIGIADTNILRVDGDPNDNEFARFTADGLEGLTDEETLAALSGDAGATFSWNSQSLTDVGSIVVDDGGTIGNDVKLTFDDTNDELEITGGDVVIGRNLQDYTEYADSLAASVVVTNANTITVTNLDRDEDCYLTSDEGAGAITDFTHWVDVNVTAGIIGSAFAPWAISNADDDLNDIDLASGDALFLWAGRGAAGEYEIAIQSLDGGAITEVDKSGTVVYNTPSYLSIVRSSTTMTVDIYSTAALRSAGAGGDVDVITGAVVGTAFRYVYGIGSYNTGAGGTDISGTVKNLTINKGLLNLARTVNAGADTDKFLVHDASGNVDFRTGANVLADLSGDAGATFDWNNQTLSNVNSISVGTDSPAAGFSGVGDIYATSGIKAMEGLYAEAVAYGAGLEVADNSLVVTHTGTGATLTAATQLITDAGGSFDSTYIGQFLKVATSTPSYTGATGEIIGVPSATTLIVSFATAGGVEVTVDATAMVFVVYPHPRGFIGDNGDIHFKVGVNKDASFKVISDEGKNIHSAHLDITAGVNNHHGLGIDFDPDTFSGCIAEHINYDATAFVDGISGVGLDFVVDNTGTSGGELHFIDVALSDPTNANLHNSALATHTGVDVVHQHIGAQFAAPIAFIYDKSAGTYTDVTTAFNGTGADVQMFLEYEDEILIAYTSTFDQLNFILTTPGDNSIKPTFWYIEAASGTWTQFSASDDTVGLKQNGSMRWDPDSFTSPIWGQRTVREVTNVANDTDYYWMKVRRTKPILPTPPTEDTIKLTESDTLYEWNSDGKLTINGIASNGDITLLQDLVMASGKLIGITGDLDLITLTSGVVTVAGQVAATNLDGILGANTPAAISGTTVTASGDIVTTEDVKIGDGKIIGSTTVPDIIKLTSAGVVELTVGQLKFPATQNASADANTLDDYEEGSWTPTGANFTLTGDAPTYTGTYVRIGKLAYFNCRIAIGAGGTIASTGNSSTISGAPFSPIGFVIVPAGNSSTVDYGHGVFWTDSKIYTPTWASFSNGTIAISFICSAA